MVNNGSGYMKAYYEKNKEKWTAKHKCECGGHYTLSNKSKHIQTRKHKTYEQKTQQKTYVEEKLNKLISSLEKSGIVINVD